MVDDGNGAPADAERNGGHGLFGMRERLALYGGTLQTGPATGAAGFALRATLPIESTSLTAIRVVVVDDQSLVRAGFRLILQSEPGIEVLAEAADGVEAISAVRATMPDVVLMDVRMPRMDGLESTRRILSLDLAVVPRVVMLTTFDMDEYVYEALKAGASGFLLKDVTPEGLVEAVRGIASGDTLLSPSITRRLVESFLRRPPASRGPSEAVRHSPRESSKSSSSSRAAIRTPKSRAPWSSARRRSRRTSPTCSANSNCATASRRSSSPTNTNWSRPARDEGGSTRRYRPAFNTSGNVWIVAVAFAAATSSARDSLLWPTYRLSNSNCRKAARVPGSVSTFASETPFAARAARLSFRMFSGVLGDDRGATIPVLIICDTSASVTTTPAFVAACANSTSSIVLFSNSSFEFVAPLCPDAPAASADCNIAASMSISRRVMGCPFTMATTAVSGPAVASAFSS